MKREPPEQSLLFAGQVAVGELERGRYLTVLQDGMTDMALTAGELRREVGDAPGGVLTVPAAFELDCQRQVPAKVYHILDRCWICSTFVADNLSE